LQDFEGTHIVAEDNEDMLGTYAMIDPQGMVYTNLHSRYHYSKQSVGDIGFLAAWAQVMDGFSNIGFERRGGKWNWSQGGVPLPLVKNSMGRVA
jgi:radical S-adenosyl methionine domain-containing protein 2